MISCTGPPTALNTGVVLNALYATAPVSRSVRGTFDFPTVTTCTCDIWSGGTVNKSAVSFLFSPVEYEVILASFSALSEPQPATRLAHPNAIAAMPAQRNATKRDRCGRFIGLRMLMAGPSLPRLGPSAREPSYNSPVLDDTQAGSSDTFARRQGNLGGSQRRACRRTR